MKKVIFIICLVVIFTLTLFIVNMDRNVEDTTNVLDDVNNESGNLNNEVIEEESKEIFAKYYDLAKEKMKTMTLEEKVGQILLVRYPETNAVEDLKKYEFGGYILFAKDFKNKTFDSAKKMIQDVKDVSEIPLLIAVDEEGGSVVRVSSNSNLAQYKFKSPSELYKEGGFEKISSDTKEKSKVLSNLGINLNLAPVVDVSTNPNDYIYKRTLGENTELTSTYSKTVIEASKEGEVSYTLKHFPGYADNKDTHSEVSTDLRTYEDILLRDIPPFKAGIESGAEAVMVSHNIVSSVDNENPASLSLKVHNILRQDLEFSGVIITDDLDMGAVSSDENAIIKAVLSGNDLIIVTDYESSINKIIKAISENVITEERIDEMCLKVISWKYYKKMM